ncbi:hypothetical protein FACS1894193_09030 [Bacilli bacterium]|nr:hypothetical protein FACS1894192_08250 [Bacilli bacterium]GHU42918.1 hypothetical protein FACS1894193_09030 [Bacilli bacterium]
MENKTENTDTLVEPVVPEENKRKKKRWLLVLLLLLALMIGGWSAFFVKHPQSLPQTLQHALNLDRAQSDTKKEAASTPAKQESIQIRGYPDVQLKVQATDMHLALENPKGNPCYIQFTIRQVDPKTGAKGEVLYESGDVAPGKFINDQTLAHGFEQGEYPIVIENHTKSLDKSHTAMNGMDVHTKLIVN